MKFKHGKYNCTVSPHEDQIMVTLYWNRLRWKFWKGLLKCRWTVIGEGTRWYTYPEFKRIGAALKLLVIEIVNHSKYIERIGTTVIHEDVNNDDALGALNQWVQDSGDGSADASERWYDHHYDGRDHTIILGGATHVFDDSVGQGKPFSGKAMEPDLAVAAQKALIEVEGEK